MEQNKKQKIEEMNGNINNGTGGVAATGVGHGITERHVTSNTRVKEIRGLYPPGCIAYDYPISDKVAENVKSWRSQIEKCLRGEDDRLVVIVGPCSVHDTESAKEYARLLVKEADRLKEDLLVVMRVYFEKPRTTVGWKGLINDPDLNGTYNINKGLRLARQLLIDVGEIGLPVGTEFLDTISPQYTSDLVSWGAIGARTTESQLHRELASALSCPIGFKNGTSGDIQIAADAIESAAGQHCFLGINEWGCAAIVETIGNPSCHIILRGGSDGPNYSAAHVDAACAKLEKSKLRPIIMIDCSHGNSLKIHSNQPSVAKNIGDQIASGSKKVFGVMIESNLVEGNQKLTPGVTDLKTLVHGKSVTDACINWETTVSVLQGLAESVQARRKLQKQ